MSVAGRPLALLWDIDGTLIDTTDLIVAALDHAYRSYIGRTLPYAEIRALIGVPLKDQIRVFGPLEPMGIDPAEMEAAFIGFYEAHRDRERIIGPAVEALRLGHRLGIPTALVTSKNHAEIRNTLPRLGVADSVDHVVSADDVRRPKPDPESVVAAVRRCGVEPRGAVFVGDTVHDMQAGAGAGVRRCAVTWGAAERAELLAEAPELVCDDPERLACVLSLAGC